MDLFDEDQNKEIKRRFGIVKSEFKRRWLAVKSRIDLFEKNNNKWLDGVFDIPKKHSKGGRPQKSFEDASERSKRRKTEELRLCTSPDKIIYAAQMKLNKERIQNEFKKRLGLRIDYPKAGFGNSNDGNISRRFFEDPELAAENKN